MKWSNFSMSFWVAIICLGSWKGLMVQAATPMAHDQQAMGLLFSAARRADPYALICLNQLRAAFFTTSSRRLLQDLSPAASAESSGKLSRGGIIGLSIAVPVLVGVILTLVIWYFIRKRHRFSIDKSELSARAENEASISSSHKLGIVWGIILNHIRTLRTLDYKQQLLNARSWMRSLWTPLYTKPMDPSTSTAGFNLGLQSCLKSFKAPSCTEPKDPGTPTVDFKRFRSSLKSSEAPSRTKSEDRAGTPTVDLNGFRSRMKSLRVPSCTKPKDPTDTPTVGVQGFPSWMKSFPAPSCTKPRDPEGTPTVGDKGLRSWLKCISGASASSKPKVYLSSACEMEFSKLQASTENFSQFNLLGEGGSARVYRAKLHGSDFGAVKLITSGGRHALADFQAEVDLMRQVRHPNLVSLLGYSNQGDCNLLVYELMRNGSLEDQLYGPKQGTGLSWHRRIKIALDAARGLEYLHEHCVPPVVHRDFKASNVLLDENFNAKISDFGLATPLEGLTREESLQLIGTIGYVAPEFFASGTLTEKSDVYAFGVTLLELLTGRKPIDHSLPPQQQSLVNWATPQLTDRKKLPKLVAPHLLEDLNLKHLYQVAAVAALCVQKEPSYRPLIADVAQSLVPLVPAELGGAMRSNSSKSSFSDFDSSRANSLRYQQLECLKSGSESFTFAGQAHEFDIPPEISSAEMP